ncbi:retrovirus-related pol polyprotein from transposon RE1 [Citrus sinensis]|nr:retrovirus-related pol polyprotein from transposon RE1 [Citrus sinensis]
MHYSTVSGLVSCPDILGEIVGRPLTKSQSCLRAGYLIASVRSPTCARSFSLRSRGKLSSSESSRFRRGKEDSCEQASGRAPLLSPKQFGEFRRRYYNGGNFSKFFSIVKIKTVKEAHAAVKGSAQSAQPNRASSSNQQMNSRNITAANISQINFSFNTPIKLDRSNYLLWRSQVLASIRGNRLEGFIDGTKPAPEEKLLLARADGSAQEIDNPEYQNWRSQDQTLLGWLLSAINEGNLSLVINCVSSFDAWRTLEKKFGVQSEARVLQLRYELNTIKKEALSIEDYCIKMKSIADKLTSGGSPITEKDLMLTILNGLGSGYRDIATFITGSKMEFDDAYALLLTHETRLEQEQDDKNLFNANYAYTNTCYPRAFYGQARGNFRRGGYFGGSLGNISNRTHGFGRGNFGPQRVFNGNFRSGNGRGQFPGQNSAHNFSSQSPRNMTPLTRNGFVGMNGSTGSTRAIEETTCQICFKVGHTADICWHRFIEDYTPTPRNFNKGKGPRSAYFANFESFNSHPSCEEYDCFNYMSPNFHPTSGAYPYSGGDAYNSGAAYMANFEGVADDGWYLDSGATHHLTNNMENLQLREEYKALKDMLFVPSITKNLLSISKLTSENSLSVEFCGNFCFVKDMKGQVLLQGSAEKGLYKLLLKPKPQSSSPTSHLSQSQINKPVFMLNGYKYYISFVDDYSRYTWIYPLKLKSDAFAVFKLFKIQVENQQQIFHLSTLSTSDSSLEENISADSARSEQVSSSSLHTNILHHEIHNHSLTESSSPHIASQQQFEPQITIPDALNTSQTQKPFHQMITRSKSGIFKLKLYTAALVNKEPDTVQEALSDKNWHQAMSDEYEALIRNKTWLLVPSSAEHKVVGNNPVVKSSTVRIMLSLAAMHKWTIRQVDVNNAFLNGELTEDVYMCQPEGFVDLQKPSYVCKLKKALYGLKQAPRAWYDKLRDILITKWRFRKSRADTSLFCKGKQDSIIFVLIYVDDILITGPNSAELEQFILELSQVFALKDLGKLSYFLGIEVSYTADNIYLSQRKYIRDLLNKTDMIECEGCDTPMVTGVKLQKEAKGHLGQYVEDPTGYRSLVGGLQYLVLTRPEIAYAVNKLSQYVSAPTLQHILACKRVLRYLKETEDFGLKFSTEGEMKLSGYTNADWACDIDDRKSTGVYCIYLGSNLISWSSMKQSVVARSSAESEYRALAAASAEISWIQSLFDELGIECSSLPMIWCDNVSAIELAKNPVYHSRTKHIELDMHFIRDKVLAKELEIRYIPSEEQIADLLTKPLTFIHFNYFRAKLNVQTCPLSLRGDVKEAHAAVKGSAQSARVSQSRNQQSQLRSFASSASLLEHAFHSVL